LGERGKHIAEKKGNKRTAENNQGGESKGNLGVERNFVEVGRDRKYMVSEEKEEIISTKSVKRKGPMSFKRNADCKKFLTIRVGAVSQRRRRGEPRGVKKPTECCNRKERGRRF